jgi:hypothetical protein
MVIHGTNQASRGQTPPGKAYLKTEEILYSVAGDCQPEELVALLAEAVVEEWLNRNGYFTIRGIKLGVQEIDLLAIAVHGSTIEARQIEVQASVRPLSYLCPLPRRAQKETGRKPMSMKRRTPSELAEGVAEWVQKKYHHEAKARLRNGLYPGNWTRELVINRVRFPEELKLLKEHGITVHNLEEIAASLLRGNTMIQSAAGSDLLELIALGREDQHP